MLGMGHLELFVQDPMASLPFYRDVLGFTVIAIQRETVVWLDAGGRELLLRPGKPPDGGDAYGAARLGIVLYTDDLDATLATLRARGLVTRGTDGSDRCITFTDPDGNWFQLVDPANH